MLDPHPARDDSVQLVAGRLGPFDERDRVGAKVVVEQLRLLAVKAPNPVEVDVRDRDWGRIPLPDREGRAGHRNAHTEGAACAADERRLAGAELAPDEHHIASAQLARQLSAQRLGLGGGVGGDHLIRTVKGPFGTVRGGVSTLRAKYDHALVALRGSDTAKAASLAGAMIANNVIALGSTVVFARLIGDYGSLAALVAYLLILT